MELSGDQERVPLESIQRYFETGNRYCRSDAPMEGCSM